MALAASGDQKLPRVDRPSFQRIRSVQRRSFRRYFSHFVQMNNCWFFLFHCDFSSSYLALPPWPWLGWWSVIGLDPSTPLDVVTQLLYQSNDRLSGLINLEGVKVIPITRRLIKWALAPLLLAMSITLVSSQSGASVKAGMACSPKGES